MNKKQHYLYSTWIGMKVRCYNPKRTNYQYYGARGIKVCQRWLDDFWNFVEDMGDRPEGHTLDRIETDGNYEPSNCKWSTHSEQASNKRPHTKGVYNGKPVKGYYKHKDGFYVACISIAGTLKYLGSFTCPLRARLAYEDAVAEKLATA